MNKQPKQGRTIVEEWLRVERERIAEDRERIRFELRALRRRVRTADQLADEIAMTAAPIAEAAE